MYKKAYGIIETKAPLHVGASAGEETGNLNLIFRDQFTQTGIVPGSSIRGRFRADMRLDKENKLSENEWYGAMSGMGEDNTAIETTEAKVKFEYASLLWLPVFCPGQPIVWVTCPSLLKRYKQIAGISASIPEPYTAPRDLEARQDDNNHKVLFFNLGFLEIEYNENLDEWIPDGVDLDKKSLVVVANNDISMLHDMALYRQSRVKLARDEKKVEGGSFFNVEALPEGSRFGIPYCFKRRRLETFR